jgi:thermitase
MRFITAVSLAVVVLVSGVTPVRGQAPAAQPFVEGELLVKFRPGTNASARADAHRQAGGAVLQDGAPLDLQRVRVARGNEQAAVARYRGNPNVQSAEPNYIRSVPEPTAHEAGTEVVPGDLSFDEQWALHNTGQLFYCFPWIDGQDLCFYIGTPDADIDAPEAWAISMGRPDIRVAVIDSGVDHTHPDIAPNYVGGWDYVEEDADPMDGHGHGTHVTGTIAAAFENLTGTPGTPEGVVGVAPSTSILGYRVCDANGGCSDFAIVRAIGQAIADGAKVINMSLGGPEYSQILDDAVQDAWNANVVVVAAAGNNGSQELFYPAAHDHVVSVGAFDEDHLRAYFSNYGNWVDISAPGNAIYSTYPLLACGGLVGPPGDIGCYTWLSGTSMASPHVAAAVALLWSRNDMTSNQQVVSALLNSADPLGVSGIRLDTWTTNGGLNIHDALAYGLTNLAPVANAGADQTVTDTDGDGGALVALDGSASNDPDGTIVGYAWSEAGGPVVSFEMAPSFWLPVGTHTMNLEVTDDQGETGTDSVVVTVDALGTAPTAGNVAVVTDSGVPVAVTLLGSDVETCELAFSLVQLPADGSLGPIQHQPCTPGATNIDTAQVVYTPAAAGTFAFTYLVNDGTLDSTVATVTVTVNAAPPPPPPPPPPVEDLSVTGLEPGVVAMGAGVTDLVVTGTGFASGASLALVNGSGPSPRVLGVTWNSSTQLTVSVDIRSGGPRRNRVWDVQVSNPDGSTATGVGLLTITP